MYPKINFVGLGLKVLHMCGFNSDMRNMNSAADNLII
jgi:hypothetical protein